MENAHDSWIALFSILGGGVFVLLAAWLGGFFNKMARDQDLYKEVGRVEGRTDRDRRGQEIPRTDYEFAMMLGAMKASVETVQEDISEIKERQETNRERQDKNISDISRLVQGVHSDVELIKGQFVDLRRTVANLARSAARAKKPHGTS